MKTFIIFIIIATVFVGCSANVNIRELEISTDMLDFGIVEINKRMFKTVDLYNNTQKKLEIHYELLNSPENDYELIVDGESETVKPAETLHIEVKIKPRTIGIKTAKLKLSYDHFGSPTEIDLQAECIKHDIQLFPYTDTIEFSHATVNSASIKMIYFKNVGNTDTTIESIDFLETNCFYIYPSSFPMTLIPDQVLMLNMYFSPKKTGSTTDVMQVQLDSSVKPYETKLIGNGVLPYIIEYMRKEYFNEDKLPENWSIEGVNNCWEVGKPDLDKGFKAYSGNYCAGTMISSNYPDNSDTRLVSPEVDLSQSIAPVLSFVHRINTVYEQWGDGGFIEIRGRNPKEPDNWTAWDPMPNVVPVYPVQYFNDNAHGAFAGIEEDSVWKQVSIELSQYRGKIIQIAWHFVSDGSDNSEGWYIDDVFIFEIRTNFGE